MLFLTLSLSAVGAHAMCAKALTDSEGDPGWTEGRSFVESVQAKGTREEIQRAHGDRVQVNVDSKKGLLSVRSEPQKSAGIHFQHSWQYRKEARGNSFRLLYGAREAVFQFSGADFPGLVIKVIHYLTKEGAGRPLYRPEYVVLEFGDRIAPCPYGSSDTRVRSLVAQEEDVDQILRTIVANPQSVFRDPKPLGNLAQARGRLAAEGSEVHQGETMIREVKVSVAFRSSFPLLEGRLFD